MKAMILIVLTTLSSHGGLAACVYDNSCKESMPKFSMSFDEKRYVETDCMHSADGVMAYEIPAGVVVDFESEIGMYTVTDKLMHCKTDIEKAVRTAGHEYVSTSHPRYLVNNSTAQRIGKYDGYEFGRYQITYSPFEPVGEKGAYAHNYLGFVASPEHNTFNTSCVYTNGRFAAYRTSDGIVVDFYSVPFTVKDLEPSTPALDCKEELKEAIALASYTNMSDSASKYLYRGARVTHFINKDGTYNTVSGLRGNIAVDLYNTGGKKYQLIRKVNIRGNVQTLTINSDCVHFKGTALTYETDIGTMVDFNADNFKLTKMELRNDVCRMTSQEAIIIADNMLAGTNRDSILVRNQKQEYQQRAPRDTNAERAQMLFN